MRPRLPSAQLLLPYLRQIDESRIYSNYGPLATQLDARLAAHFGLPDCSVTTVANATLGLAIALSTQGARPGTLCVMPAWTFVASAQAATLAGLVPFFVDVDPSTWALDPAAVYATIEHAPVDVGAVMPVVPFGQPIDVDSWERFAAATGLPVVIDAAAGFDTLIPGQTPAVVSLHATKVLGVGEGAFVTCADPSFILGIRTRANFGFYGTREALVPALNAKLSEYQVAVAHAALDEWQDARTDWLAVGARYRARLAQSHVMRLQDGFGESWVSSVCVVALGEHDAAYVEQSLREAGIETRRWWGEGAHTHRATNHLPRGPLPVTTHLASSTIGLPCYRDLEGPDIDRIVDCVLASAVAHEGKA